MNMSDLDWQFLKCIGYLHSSDSLTKGDSVPLQQFLEESIKTKLGLPKDLSHLVSSSIQQLRIEEFKPLSIYDDSKGSNSDNELELDLLKEDLMCIVCNGMDVGARNRLLECSDCHALYHQDCHKPVVTIQDSFDSWACQNCKDVNNAKTLTSPINDTSLNDQSPTGSENIKTDSLKSTTNLQHVNGPTYKSFINKNTEKSSKIALTGGSKSSSTSKSQVSSSSSSRNSVTPNINIISADKRIQNMKKKAAKLQEKRKLPK